jgi:hypothetical protein
LIPSVLRRDDGHLFFKLGKFRGICVNGLTVPMYEGDSIGDARNEVTDSKAVAPHVHAAATSAGEIDLQTICLVEGQGELSGWYLKANMTKIVNRSDAMMGNLIDVESELSLNVLALAFGVVDACAVLPPELGELYRHGQIGRLRMSDGAADVVGQSTDGKGKFVGVSGVSEEVYDKITRTDIMGQIRERSVTEWIVANILNDASCIGVCARVLKLGRGEGGIATKKKRNNGLLPGEIDELFMGEKRVCPGR